MLNWCGPPTLPVKIHRRLRATPDWLPLSCWQYGREGLPTALRAGVGGKRRQDAESAAAIE